MFGIIIDYLFHLHFIFALYKNCILNLSFTFNSIFLLP